MPDILVPIESNDLSKLSEIYKEVTWAPYVHSFIETAIMWKMRGRNELTTFFSPNNSWKEDGTFIGLMQFGNYDLFMFTLDPKCENLCRGIIETKIIDWNKPAVLFNLHYSHHPYVMKVFAEMNLSLNYSNVHDIYYLNKEAALALDTEIMSEVHNEILMNIPDEDLEKLADMYKEHGDIPYASSILKNGIKIRKKRSYLIRFMSTGNCWRSDGTFFALMEFPHSYDLVVCTLDKTCKNVYEGLMRTKRLHFHRPLVFFAVHNTIYPTILKVIEDKKLRVKSDNSYYIYSISRTEAIHFKLECPDELEVRKLSPSHATIVNSLWPLRFPHSEELLASLIEMNGGFGLFLKSTNELVSWALKTGLGQIGVVQTVETYQKKGYASVVTRILAKIIADEDEDPTATISVSNVNSQNMFKKLGFTNRGLCNYITLKKIN